MSLSGTGLQVRGDATLKERPENVGKALDMTDGQVRLKYHCVKVIAGANACEAALLLGNLRLLSAEAPFLPLKTCDHPADCGCTYRHFDDRRQGLRRESDHARVALARQRTERRTGRGRREIDFD